MPERLFIIFSFLLAAHLIFKKKDKFFIFRALGVIASFIMVFYSLFKHYGLDPELLDYSFFLSGISLLIILVKFLKSRNFYFLKPRKKDFDLKGLGLSFLLIGFVWLVLAAYFRELFLLPHYISIDAPLHFSRFRHFVEFKYNSNDSAPAFAMLYVFSNLFFFTFRGVESVLYNFQLTNILIFSLTAVYFYLLFSKKFAIKSKLLKMLCFLLLTFGFFFNLFIFGFAPQLIALFLLLVFWDLLPYAKKSWASRLFLATAAASIYLSYTFWIGVLAIYLGLVFLKQIYFSEKRWKILLKVSPLIIIGGYFILKKISILRMASEEGEVYRVFTANFWMFIVFFFGGGYFILKKWRKDSSEMSSAFLATLLFSLGFALTHLLGYVSSYTFFKGLFLTGSFIFYAAFYFLDQMERTAGGKAWKKFNKIFAAVIVILMLYPFIPWGSKNELQAKLVSSIDKEGIWSFKQRPLDIFYFNIKAFEDRGNRVENFISFDREKLEFLRELRPYLPEDFNGYYSFYDSITRKVENRMMMAADFKTSYWVFALTKIWNRSLDVMEVHNTKVIDYDDWVKNHHDPYLMILDTQTTNRWLWLNEKKFKWDDFEVLYQKGGNYLLKYKK
ncbi:MAG: hypothetical protein ABIC19_00895 [Patescibacteria group bacterium]